MEYLVKIEAFEGPLDLLLHLINRLEIDIYDIPMAEISEQYLLYVQTMQELELDNVSEYLVMAATLLAIKSKMLLPTHEETEDYIFEEEEDPRNELVQQLIEYKKYKEVALTLKEREHHRSLMYTKPPSDLSIYMDDASTGQLTLDFSLHDMLGAYHKLLRRKKLQKPLTGKITSREKSIEDKMDFVLNILHQQSGKVNFFDFFPFNSKEDIVLTFLAMLELIKQKKIIVEQKETFGDIFLSLRKEFTAVGS